MYSHGIVAVLILSGALSGLGQSASAQAPTVRDERCANMRRQLELALSHSVDVQNNEDVTRLRAHAIQLCSAGKQAQGLRALSEALGIVEQKQAGR